MKYAFLNARIKSRTPSILTKEKTRNLLISKSRTELYNILYRYDIKEQDKTLLEASIKLDFALNSEIHNLALMVKNSRFLTFFLKRFDLFSLLESIQNNAQRNPIYSGQRMQQFFRFSMSTHEIADINRFFGFNINQDTHEKDLQDELVKEYYTKLLRLSNDENDYREIVQPELYLLQKLYKFKILDLPSKLLPAQKESAIFMGNPLLVDVKITSFMEEYSRRFAVSDPLGGSVLINFAYALEQHFKFIKLLFASIVKDINIDPWQLW